MVEPAIIRVFVSSPGDVTPEREAVDRVVADLNARLGGSPLLKTVRWEKRHYTASSTFQDQILDPGQCDLVVTLFWTRLGSELPPGFGDTQPDGRPWPSGTVYELAKALAANRASGGATPDVLVYRKTKDAPLPTDDLEKRRQAQNQFERFAQFWEDWFVSGQGHFKAAFKTFEDLAPFETLFARDLLSWLDARGHLHTQAAWDVSRRGSPFRGLLPFEAEHRDVFFGRARAIERGFRALKEAAAREAPFLLIAGESGSGKSSLARAGLLPLITTPGMIEGVDLWRSAILDLGAGGDVFALLAEQLFTALPELAESDFSSPAALAAHLANGGGPEPVLRAIDRAARAFATASGLDRPGAARLVLLIDQMERLFALPDAARQKLVALTAALVAARVHVVATLRIDALGPFLAEPALAALAETGGRLDLAPPGPAEIEDMVRRPAEAAGLRYESDASAALDETIIEAARGRDALPLLQFLLEELFIRRDAATGTITRTAYDALGGLEGAIGRQAEAEFAKLPETDRARLPRLLRALVQADRRQTLSLVPARRAEIERDDHDRALIEALAGARILVLGGEAHAPHLRLIHEAVLRTWPEAKKVVAANTDFYRVRDEVEAERAHWRRAGERNDRLLRAGSPLKQAEDLVNAHGDELDAGLCDFVRASGRRARIRQGALVAATLVFGAVAVLAGAMYFEAEGQRRIAGREAAEALRQKGEAERQTERAEQEKANAQAQTREAERQAGIAEAQTDEAKKQADIARQQEALAKQRSEEAERERARAEKNFAAAKQAVDGLTFDIAQGLRNFEGVSTAMVTRVLDRVRAVVDRLGETAPEDAGLQRSRHVMLIEIGNTLQDKGDGPGALKAFEEARDVSTRLAKSDEGNAGWQRDLSLSYEKLGDVQVAQGNLPDALKSYRDGLAIHARLVKSEEGNARSQRDLSVSFIKLGDVQVAQGNLPDALKSYRDALAIHTRLAKSDEGNAGWQRDLSVSFNKLGDVLVAQGNLPDALKSYRDGLQIAERLAKSDEGNAGWQRDLSLSYEKLGNVLVAQGNLPDALKSYRDGLQIAERLAKSDEGNAGWQRDLSVSLEKIGNVLVAQGSLADALRSYRDALAISERLAKLDAGNADWQRDLGVSLAKIGNVLVAQGNLADALRSYRDAFAIRERLAKSDVGNAGWQRDLSVSLETIGDVLVAQGNLADALKSYRDAFAIRERLAKSDTGNAGWQRDLSASYVKIGNISVQRGATGEVKQAFENALKIYESLIARNAGDAQSRIFSVVPRWQLAGLDPPQARVYLESALAILKPMVAAGLLDANRRGWVAQIEAQLAALAP